MNTDLKALCGFIMVIVLLFTAVCFPIAWCDGHAKSAFLKTQGIELPWYQATWLNVQANAVNLKQEKK